VLVVARRDGEGQPLPGLSEQLQVEVTLGVGAEQIHGERLPRLEIDPVEVIVLRADDGVEGRRGEAARHALAVVVLVGVILAAADAREHGEGERVGGLGVVVAIDTQEEDPRDLRGRLERLPRQRGRRRGDDHAAR